MKSIKEIIGNLRVAMTDARQNESHFESWMILNEAICDAIDALAEQPAQQQEPVAEVRQDMTKACPFCAAGPYHLCGHFTSLPAQQQEPMAIYYMRDNHTFKKLSANVSTALVEIEQEFNDGWTHGSLCSKREGFPMIHAHGSAKRLEFFAKCKATLEQWLPTSPPAQRKPLTDDEIEKLREKTFSTGNPYCPVDGKSMRKAARAIEAAHGIKEKS